MFKNILIIAVVVLFVVGTSSLVLADVCSRYPNCQTCISPHAGVFCGWCSGQNYNAKHETIPKCAGYQPGHEMPFKCEGIFSTEQCFSGYTCDNTTFQCVKGAPGTGTSLATCQQHCVNNNKIYKCDEVTHKCLPCPPGTQGGTSLLNCEQECSKHHTATATGSPASHAPTPPPTTLALFACNSSSGKCEASVPGKGESKEACEANCKKGAVTYTCNSFTKTCEPMKNDPSGMSKQKCQEVCNPTSAPKPPSNFPLGLYRGLQIDNNYEMGVVYVDVTDAQFTIVKMKQDKVAWYYQGTPSHTPPSVHNEHADIMNVKITAPSQFAGKTLGTITDLGGLNTPETSMITMAYSELGSEAPTTITGAFTNPKEHVLALAKCITPECKFELPSLSSSSSSFTHSFLNSLFSSSNKQQQQQNLRFTDHCSSHGQSCQVCLASKGCGWCSTNVTYLLPNGQKQEGTQCSGFSAKVNTTEWSCDSVYSTLSCPVLYKCNNETHQCVQTTTGGIPKETCETQCTLPPTPPPAVKQYVCNLTTKQCTRCEKTSCPGMMPKQQCEQACAHHKKGPPSHLVGVWRGFYINSQYKDVEHDLVFTNTSVTAYTSGAEDFTANVTSLGNDAMEFKFLSGRYRGFTRWNYYQEAAELPKNDYEAITFAAGKIGGSVPESFTPAMVTPGMDVLIYYKCNESPCKFKKP